MPRAVAAVGFGTRSIANSSQRRLGVNQSFFERPILNSPYADLARHWELDADGQPTNRIIDNLAAPT